MYTWCWLFFVRVGQDILLCMSCFDLLAVTCRRPYHSLADFESLLLITLFGRLRRIRQLAQTVPFLHNWWLFLSWLLLSLSGLLLLLNEVLQLWLVLLMIDWQHEPGGCHAIPQRFLICSLWTQTSLPSDPNCTMLLTWRLMGRWSRRFDFCARGGDLSVLSGPSCRLLQLLNLRGLFKFGSWHGSLRMLRW